MIRREGLLLSVIAIPAGLLLGGGLAYITLPDGWSFVNYGIASWDKDAFSRGEVFLDSEYYLTYDYDVHGNPKTYGITDSQLKGNLNNELEDEIRKIAHVKDIHIERTATGVISYQGAAFTQTFCPLSKDDTEYFQLSADGNNSYEYLVEHDAVLIIDCAFSEKLNGIMFIPGKTLQISYFDGEEQTIELEIAAVSKEKVKSHPARTTFCMSDTTMRKIWGEMNGDADIWHRGFCDHVWYLSFNQYCLRQYCI